MRCAALSPLKHTRACETHALACEQRAQQGAPYRWGLRAMLVHGRRGGWSVLRERRRHVLNALDTVWQSK
jgi:hypothetical protein